MAEKSPADARTTAPEPTSMRARTERGSKTFGLRSSGVIYALVVMVLLLLVAVTTADGRPF